MKIAYLNSDQKFTKINSSADIYCPMNYLQISLHDFQLDEILYIVVWAYWWNKLYNYPIGHFTRTSTMVQERKDSIDICSNNGKLT